MEVDFCFSRFVVMKFWNSEHVFFYFPLPFVRNEMERKGLGFLPFVSLSYILEMFVF